MENFNPNANTGRGNFFSRNSKSIKAIIIGFLVILLLIPMVMIMRLIGERDSRESEAIQEVSSKWSGSQVVSGPYLSFDYIINHESIVEGKKNIVTETKNLILFPDELNIDGQLKTETRKRGIYEVNVYQSDINISGKFSSDELKKKGLDIEKVQFQNVTVCLGITDMRGIGEQIKFSIGDSVYNFESGMNGKDLGYNGVSKVIDLPDLLEKAQPYKINLKLKGSQALYFAPLGKTTKVLLNADWGTPSFDGNFLPETSDITPEQFTAKWQILDLNRGFAQTFMRTGSSNILSDSTFGVKLKMPVEQYQQSMRSAKYAVLIILLTFVVIFFVEIIDKKSIHPLQYLLVGLALCLFYTLLTSISEQLNFTLAYIIASILTIALISLYILGIMKKKKPALIICGLLVGLYSYVFILIQLETYALLAGSLGLFIILALIMYFSKKIDWFN